VARVFTFKCYFKLQGNLSFGRNEKLYPTSKLTLKTEGRKKTITFSNIQLGSCDVWTITNGIVTSYIIYGAKNKVEYKAIFSTSSPLITPPIGPFMELGKLLADPSYKDLQK
jgi:hypothetical protein